MCVAYGILSIKLKRLQAKLGLTPSAATKKAIWLGILWIQVPILPIFIGPFLIQKEIFFNENSFISIFCLVFGFLGAWLWWSVNVSLWRRWAARTGVNAEELQFEGQSSSILWPRGHFFERTEYDRIFDNKRK
jgi:hypothetical protein